MQTITVKKGDKLAIGVTAGQNNAVSYTMAKWNPTTKKYKALLTGLASFEDEAPDSADIGTGAANDGAIFLCRAYIYPYVQGSSGPFAAEFFVSDGNTQVGSVDAEVDEPLTLNMIFKIKAED